MCKFADIIRFVFGYECGRGFGSVIGLHPQKCLWYGIVLYIVNGLYFLIESIYKPLRRVYRYIQMSYVIVENDQPTLELIQFTFCEDKTPNVVSPAIPQFTFCEDKTPNVVSPAILQIPDDCVEYIGKLMCGEIVFTQDHPPMNVITNELQNTVRTPTAKQERDTSASVLTKDVSGWHPDTPTGLSGEDLSSKDCSTRVFQHIYEIHIHICECITVFSCCLLRQQECTTYT